MSNMALLWIGVAAGLALLSFSRATYGFSLYLLTFFLFPGFWWWGRPLPNLRWNFLAGAVFLGAVLIQAMMRSEQTQQAPATKRVSNMLVAILVNATLVHVLLSPSMGISLDNYVRLLKFVLLFSLIVACVRNPKDLRLVLWSIVLGAAYIGYEVTINDRGNFVRGRLEGIGASGVDDANALASLMATVLPLAGGLFFWGTRKEKLLVAVTGPLILNVVLLCSSRGALLAMIVGAVAFVANAPGKVRRKALFGLGLAGLAASLLLGDPEILARFSTTFTSAEERDGSASTRLVYWTAGLRMLADHPLGAGGDGYKRAYASQYLAGVGVDAGARSVHNGLLNEACEWGIQGFVLRMLFLASAVLMTRRTVRELSTAGKSAEAAIGCCLIASVVTFVCSCAFGDYMDEEWGYWVPALMVSYARLYGAPVPAEVDPSRTPVSTTGLRAPLYPSRADEPSPRVA